MYANWFFKLQIGVQYYLLTPDQYQALIDEFGADALPSFRFDEDDKLWYAQDIEVEELEHLLDFDLADMHEIYSSTQGTHGG